ncbi:hypothetical protein HOH87_02470 [bacterium]|jgi:hypothetical protein|nr:hypothetical protein [bacterium]
MVGKTSSELNFLEEFTMDEAIASAISCGSNTFEAEFEQEWIHCEED